MEETAGAKQRDAISLLFYFMRGVDGVFCFKMREIENAACAGSQR